MVGHSCPINVSLYIKKKENNVPRAINSLLKRNFFLFLLWIELERKELQMETHKAGGWGSKWNGHEPKRKKYKGISQEHCSVKEYLPRM